MNKAVHVTVGVKCRGCRATEWPHQLLPTSFCLTGHTAKAVTWLPKQAQSGYSAILSQMHAAKPRLALKPTQLAKLQAWYHGRLDRASAKDMSRRLTESRMLPKTRLAPMPAKPAARPMAEAGTLRSRSFLRTSSFCSRICRQPRQLRYPFVCQATLQSTQGIYGCQSSFDNGSSGTPPACQSPQPNHAAACVLPDQASSAMTTCRLERCTLCL